jgi:hypothetical protein
MIIDIQFISSHDTTVTDQTVQQSDRLADLDHEHQEEDSIAVSPRHTTPLITSDMQETSSTELIIDRREEDSTGRSMSVSELGGEEQCMVQVKGPSVEVCRLGNLE